MKLMKIILAGGSGLVGSRLIPLLMAEGHEVVVLTTKKTFAPKSYAQFHWNPLQKIFPQEAIVGTDVVVNLAGFSVANPWTPSNKSEMISSRIQTTDALVQAFHTSAHHVKLWIGASASGFYVHGNEARLETDPSSDDFLGKLTSAWEICNQRIGSHAERLVLMRLPVILAKEAGALQKMLPLYRMGLGAPVGQGNQMMSWVHVDDVAHFILYAIHNVNVQGIYNVSAPEEIDNRAFSKILAHTLKRPHILPAVPAWILKMMFGEMSKLVLQGRNLNSHKILATGFQFTYASLQSALSNLLQKKV
jgi:uncharacterized protein (TIGR01777 family)